MFWGGLSGSIIGTAGPPGMQAQWGENGLKLHLTSYNFNFGSTDKIISKLSFFALLTIRF